MEVTTDSPILCITTTIKRIPHCTILKFYNSKTLHLIYFLKALIWNLLCSCTWRNLFVPSIHRWVKYTNFKFLKINYCVLGCLLDDSDENKIWKKVVPSIRWGFVIHTTKVWVKLKLKPKNISNVSFFWHYLFFNGSMMYWGVLLTIVMRTKWKLNPWMFCSTHVQKQSKFQSKTFKK